MDIFDLAMEKEKFAQNYYHDMAEKTTHVGFRSIFNMLAGEEEKHLRIVQNMKEQIHPKEITNVDVIKDSRAIFAKMKGRQDHFDTAEDEIEVYKKAREIEADSRKYYMEKADESDDPKIKEVFGKLAEEERKHYFLLDNIVELVSRPQQWLENPEWYHLEEY